MNTQMGNSYHNFTSATTYAREIQSKEYRKYAYDLIAWARWRTEYPYGRRLDANKQKEIRARLVEYGIKLD